MRCLYTYGRNINCVLTLFIRKFAIHGHNVHLPASQKNKLRWFVYLCEDLACSLQYVGSTTDVCSRWAGTKKACLDQNNTNTGLYKHFVSGCPSGTGDLSHLRWTLIDFVDTTVDQLERAGHQGEPSAGVGSVRGWRPRKTSGFAAWAHFMVVMV